MSEYLTLIPLLREMCFPCYHSCLEKKKRLILGNWNFYVFSFGNWANVIWVMKMKSDILLFQGVTCLSFYSILLPSVILYLFFLSCICSFFLCMADCMSPYPVEKAGSLSSIFICFISISVCKAGDKMAAVSFDRLHLFALLPRLSGFSFSLPNILLPVSSCSF